MLDNIARFIVKNRNKIGIGFIVAVIISLMLMPLVKINYDLSEYVPDDEDAKRGLNIVEEEFSMQCFARAMVNNVSLVEAKEYKEQIEKVDGVDLVMWLDDDVDIYRPLDFISQDLLDEYYKDGSAIFEIMFDEDEYSSKTNAAVEKIQKILPADSNIIGSAVDTKSAQDTVQTEISKIMIILVPVVIVILILTTDSYLSPLLFMAVIGTSIFLNMGTNVIFKHVSFLTYSIVAALQLAVSMDYSVFMLHRFEAEDKTDIEEAMVRTIKASCTSITSSALTTVAGFLALVFMGFTIGKDMGLVFAKGIIFSLLSVIFFMPCLIIKFYPWIEKTRHKSFMPSFGKFSEVMNKFSYLMIAIVIIVTIPSYVAQKQNVFLYGSSSFGGGEGTKVYEDEKAIVSKFGRSNPIIILVPVGDYISEKELAAEIEKLEVVKKVQSLANLVDEGIPDSFVPSDTYQKFRSKNYSRILVYLKTSSESDLAFNSITTIREIVSKYYGDSYEMTGVIPITMNIRDVVNKDYNVVNLLSIGMVLLILLFTFRSRVLPFVLIVVIESGIFINMAIPYFSGQSMMFLGYLIVSSIQLGATIDYAILFTNNYMEERKTNDKVTSSHLAVKRSIPSILTSGGILTCAAYLIKFNSSINAISEIGELIGRGTLLSMFLVIFFLPHILVLFDSLIYRSTIKADRIKKLRKKIQEKREKKLKKESNKHEAKVNDAKSDESNSDENVQNVEIQDVDVSMNDQNKKAQGVNASKNSSNKKQKKDYKTSKNDSKKKGSNK